MGLANGLGAVAGAGGLITNTLTYNVSQGYSKPISYLRIPESRWMEVGVRAGHDRRPLRNNLLPRFRERRRSGIYLLFLFFPNFHFQSWAREPEKEETFNEFVRRMCTLLDKNLFYTNKLSIVY